MRAYLIGSLRRLDSDGARYFDPRAPVEKVNRPRLILKLSRWFCWAAEPGTWSRCPLSRFTDWLVAHHRDDIDRSNSGKSKGACTALDRSMQRPLTYGPRSAIVTVTV